MFSLIADVRHPHSYGYFSPYIQRERDRQTDTECRYIYENLVIRTNSVQFLHKNTLPKKEENGYYEHLKKMC